MHEPAENDQLERDRAKASPGASWTHDESTTAHHGLFASVDAKRAVLDRGHPSCCAGADAALEAMPDEELLYDLADLFKVFGDTTRIKLLYALMGRELCVADLATAINATQSAVSHQLRTLKQARLVKFRRDGKNVIYSLSDDHVYSMLNQGMSHLCE